MGNIIQRGAEAVLYREGSMLIKDRVEKGYRLPEIDRKMRRLRTRQEARLLDAAARAGVDVPRVIEASENTLKMEFIDGSRLKDIFNGMAESAREEVCTLIGSAVGRMHSASIVHGDLTTSNMIIKNEPLAGLGQCGMPTDGQFASAGNCGSSKLYIIDFGLGKFSGKIEDKAVDLYLLCEALKAAHFKYLSCSWQYILKSYSEGNKDAAAVIGRLRVIENRRRYKGG